MGHDGSSEKSSSVFFEKLSITSLDQTSSYKKSNSENLPLLQIQILPAMQYIR